jgi:hypothetical protein
VVGVLGVRVHDGTVIFVESVARWRTALAREAKPGFILGTSPRNRKEITTLRVIPTVRESFKPAGIQQANFDSLPNYWDAPIHNIRKRTERTRNCDTCHEDRKGFLTMETLLKNSSRTNLELIHKPKPIPISK